MRICSRGLEWTRRVFLDHEPRSQCDYHEWIAATVKLAAWLKAGYLALTVMFAGFTVVYAWAAVRQTKRGNEVHKVERRSRKHFSYHAKSSS